jgi:hypothetical protein
MGRLDFDYGFNVAPPAATDPPTYAPVGCMGQTKCTTCNKFHGYCSEVAAQLTGATDRDGSIYTNPGKPCHSWWDEENKKMDLTKQVSGKKKDTFEKRDWITPEDLPAKGSSKWKIDGARDAKKNKTAILVFVDLTRGKMKRVLALRKGFTLDNFVDACGPITEKWKGKSIDLERGGSDGQYVNVAG